MIYTYRDTAVQAVQKLLEGAEEAEQALLYLAIVIARTGLSAAILSEVERVQEFDPSPEWAKIRATIVTAVDRYEVGRIINFDDEGRGER